MNKNNDSSKTWKKYTDLRTKFEETCQDLSEMAFDLKFKKIASEFDKILEKIYDVTADMEEQLEGKFGKNPFEAGEVVR